MAEIIDMLVQKELVAGVTDTRQFFTVNTAVNDIELDAGAGSPQGDLLPEDLPNYKFTPKDNITILSLGVSLPYNFILSTRILFVNLYWKDAVGTGPLNVGQSNKIEIPFVNYELSIGAYVPWPTPRSLPYWIVMLVGANPDPAIKRARISMLGVPAALNGAILPVTSFCKVSHNLAFTA